MNNEFDEATSLMKTAEEFLRDGEKEYSKLYRNQENIKFVLDAMFGSTNDWNGTSYRSRFEDKKYQYAGKTGTAQVKKITKLQELDLDTSEIPYEERSRMVYSFWTL